MNRPTIDVDDLLEMTDEALAAGDFPQAVEMLRKAASIAPLRKDIRNKMAIALEGAPISKAGSRRHTTQSPGKGETVVLAEQPLAEQPIDAEPQQQIYYEDEAGGREVIGQIARKAFEAAAGQTARASNATRHLSNLLQQGIHTWKSSMAELKTKPLSQTAEIESNVSASIQSRVFTPETDLNNYLKRASASENSVHSLQADLDDDQYDRAEVEEIEPVVPSAATSKKQTKPVIPGKLSRPADVEDVLAAGISGFIEAIGHANKIKILYCVVYVAFVLLFGYACFDVSRKFPEVETVPGGQVSAGFGVLNLNETQGSDDAVATARAMVAAGQTEEAAQLLRVQLKLGQRLHNRDLIRIELAALLNQIAEQHLRSNEFPESVARYKEALEILPADAALQLRLGNSLYFYGSLGTNDKILREAAMSEAAVIIGAVISKDPSNLQAQRLLALVHEAQGESKAAKAAWKIVKNLASADSAEFKEAESHLK